MSLHEELMDASNTTWLEQNFSLLKISLSRSATTLKVSSACIHRGQEPRSYPPTLSYSSFSNGVPTLQKYSEFNHLSKHSPLLFWLYLVP